VASLVVLFVLTIAGVVLVTSQRAVLTDIVDETLLRASQDIIAALDSGTLTPVIPGRGDEESFAIVHDASGQVIAATAGAPVVEMKAPAAGVEVESEAVAPDGADFRVRAEVHGDETIIVGTPLDDVDDSVDALTRSLRIAVPGATALLAVAIWFLVGRVLRPVEKIRAQVAEISASSLDRRVPEPATHDEIARLARTMNSMLARLEATADRQRRFVSDASHELRSPLTRIRTALEVDLAHPLSADPTATHRRALADAEQLQRLIDDLLVLARLDERMPPARSEPVDLDDIVLTVVRELGPTDLTIDVSGVSSAQVVGDAGQLTRVVRNVLENAARYGSTVVAVEVAEAGDDAVLTVADDGPGVPPEFRDHIFERFTRADAARPPGSGGSGLGLAIAHELVAAHGGTLTLESNGARGARFVVRFPAATPQRSQ
jgi:signal transduction histidine kinase